MVLSALSSVSAKRGKRWTQWATGEQMFAEANGLCWAGCAVLVGIERVDTSSNKKNDNGLLEELLHDLDGS